MITATNYNAQKISLDLLQDKKSRDGKKYQNIPILYDGRKALVHLCGRFQLEPDFSIDNFPYYSDSLAIDVDADNRKLFEDFEKKLQSEFGKVVELIQYNRVYLKVFISDEGEMHPKFWKVIEKDGEEYKERIWGKDSLNWKIIEGEIIFSIENIYVGEGSKNIICVAKEIFVREMSYPVGEIFE